MPLRCLVTAATGQWYPYREPGSLSGHRRRLMHRARGRVLDLSPRWAPNQACYHPGAVDHLSVVSAPRAPLARPHPATDPSPEPHVLGGDLDTVDLPAAAFDTVVATMALCTAGDLDRLLLAIRASLRPDGQLLVLEHVRGSGLVGLAQVVASPFEATGTGCRIDQQLAPALRRCGLELTDCARFTAWIGAGVPTPCLAGVVRLQPARAGIRSDAEARRPAQGRGAA